MTRTCDWAVAYDMDGTLTTKTVGALMPVVSDNCLPAQAADEMDALRRKYVTLFNAQKLTDEEYQHWLSEEIAMYVRYGLKRDSYRRALYGVKLRPGAVEHILELAALGIPQAVISAGVADFIEIVLAANGVREAIGAVYGAWLTHDEDDQVSGHLVDTVVHPGNKGIWSRHFASGVSIDPARLIAVGDSHGDRNIGHLAEHRIGLADTEKQAELLRSLPVMGEVYLLVDGHLQPVSDSIKRRLGLIE